MVYIALQRGINVGGENMIKMADLKKALESAGLQSVRTYIQSGNVLFESDRDEAALKQIVEKTIEAAFGFSVPVVLRTGAALQILIDSCPFSAEDIAAAQAATDAEVLYAALLWQTPAKEKIAAVQTYQNGDERMIAAGRDVYLLFCQSIRNSKLASHLTKLDEAATVRNWKTLTQLAKMAKSMCEATKVHAILSLH